MTAMNRTTGAAIDGLNDIQQSVGIILGTRIGSYPTLREFGSLLPDLIDQPMTATNVLRIYAATVLAVTRWEDRISPRQVGLSISDTPGKATVILDAVRKDIPAANARTRLLVPVTL